MAGLHAEIRFAVFSDSVIISAKSDRASEFMEVLAYLQSQWTADFIFSRGAASLGEVSWVDHFTDSDYRGRANLSMSRVYGKALVDAHSLEGKSGPGAVVFLTDEAAVLFRSVNSNSVLAAPTDVAVLYDRGQVNAYFDVHRIHFESARSYDEKRQHKASMWYFEQMRDRGVFMPDSFANFADPRYLKAMQNARD